MYQKLCSQWRTVRSGLLTLNEVVNDRRICCICCVLYMLCMFCVLHMLCVVCVTDVVYVSCVVYVA